MRYHRNSEKVNAGSMADIAFLLLIFFLVSTTITTDAGINRTLPAYCPTNDCATNTAERNVFRIVLNNNNEILINDQLVDFQEISNLVTDFVDNNGDTSCSYCFGDELSIASDNPQKAIISLQHGRKTSYKLFIKVQNEITKAYKNLRHVYSESNFQKPSHKLSPSQLSEVKHAYPINISEHQ